jgi:hypothetical protein
MHIKKSHKRDFQNEASAHRTEQNNVDNATIFSFLQKISNNHRGLNSYEIRIVGLDNAQKTLSVPENML